MEFLTNFVGDILKSEATQKALVDGLYVLMAWIALKIKGFVEANTAKLVEEKKQADLAGKQVQFNATKTEALHLIEVAVAAAEETTVKGLKAKSEDGTITKAEGIEIKNEVIQNTLKQLGEEKQSILQAGITDVKAYFADVIHANLTKLKLLKP